MTRKQSAEDVVKIFGMTNQLLEADLDQVERRFNVNLGRQGETDSNRDTSYYPQFDEAIRREAGAMGRHYEIFYCLEKSIRQLITETLEVDEGADWWDSDRVPTDVKSKVDERMKREQDSGVTPRSTDPIDFTTFGELGEIIKASWMAFGSIFNSKKAVERVLSNLNTLRAPIAHCCPLAEDEVLRLQLSMRDWFRLME